MPTKAPRAPAAAKAPSKPRAKRPVKPMLPPAHTTDNIITVDVPLPPSTNRIWRRGVSRKTGKGFTYLDPAYARWKEAADAALVAQKAGKDWHTITGAFDVRLTITAAKRFRTDLDNRVKAVADWAVQAGLIAEDKWQNAISVSWGEVPLGARLTLTPVDFSP